MTDSDSILSLNKTGWEAANQGRLTDALSIAQDSVKQSEVLYGENHEKTLPSLQLLAAVQQKLQNLSGAESTYGRLLAIYEETNGWNTKDAGIVLLNLAGLYEKRKDFQSAEKYYRRAIDVLEQVCDPNDTTIALACNNIGNIVRQRSDWEEAEQFCRRALSIFAFNLGEQHAVTATGIDNLGAILEAKLDFDGAEALYRKAYGIRHALFGPDNPLTLTSKVNIARTAEKRPKTSCVPRSLGTLDRPFESPAALLRFLESDEPKRYVFRGQTRYYDTPMMPSGFRDRFCKFGGDAGLGDDWSGITLTESEIKQQATDKWQALDAEQLQGVEVDDGQTVWDLSEDAFQRAFETFFNQPRNRQVRDLANALRESVVPAISAVIGGELADLLCQQYGLTSTALDASTDPRVAMFFATHEAPYYLAVSDSPTLGVVYRWPRHNATVAEDLLLPLESPEFESVTSTFLDFVQKSPGLKVVKDRLVHYTSPTLSFDKRMLAILSEDEQRAWNHLRFPPGTFGNSRMGRQRAALLHPKWKQVQVVKQGDQMMVVTGKMDGLWQLNPQRAVLISDLVRTHQGQAFYFRHDGEFQSDELDKHCLWPSLEPIKDWPLTDDLRLSHLRLVFEDKYLEMMLRFFSTCSPCDIFMAELRQTVDSDWFKKRFGPEYQLDPAAARGIAQECGIQGKPEIHRIGLANGVVDLGYSLHPSEALQMTRRKTQNNVPPTLRHLDESQIEEFRLGLASALSGG